MNEPTRRQRRQAHREYQKVLADATARQMKVAGVYKPDGQPTYFAYPPDATNEQIAGLAFAHLHGRPVRNDELMLQALVAEHRERTGS